MARHLYARYLKTSIQPSNDEIKDFPSYLMGSALTEETKGLKATAARGLHVEGQINLAKFVIQRFDSSTEVLTAYVCVDLNDARVLNKAGEDVTPQSRVNRQTALAVFKKNDGRMKLAEDNAWSGRSVC